MTLQQCQYCSKRFRTKQKFLRHISTHLPFYFGVYLCLKCDKKFETELKLLEHVVRRSHYELEQSANIQERRQNYFKQMKDCEELYISEDDAKLLVDRKSRTNMDIGSTVANMNDQLYTATRTKTSTITQNSSSHHNTGTISDPISIASPVSPSSTKMSQQGYQSTGLLGSMSTGISTGFTTSLSTPNNFDTIVSQSYSDAENYMPSTTPVLYNSLSIQGEATMFPHNNDTNLLSTQGHFLPPPPKSRVRKRAPVPEIINPTPLKQGRMEGLATEVSALKMEIQGLKTEIQGLNNQLELVKATSNKNTEDILQALEDNTNYQFELFSALTTNVTTEQKRNLLEVLRGAMLKLESDSPSTPKA